MGSHTYQDRNFLAAEDGGRNSHAVAMTLRPSSAEQFQTSLDAKLLTELPKASSDAESRPFLVDADLLLDRNDFRSRR